MLMRNGCCVCKRTGSKSHVLEAEESATGRHRVEKSILFQYFWCKRETTVNELVKQRYREYKRKWVYERERERDKKDYSCIRDRMREYGKERKKERDRDCTFVINARQAKVCMWTCSRKDKCMWEKLTESIEDNLNVSSFEKENKNLFPSALIILFH